MLGIIALTLVLLGACAEGEGNDSQLPAVTAQNDVGVDSSFGAATPVEDPDNVAPVLLFDTCDQIDQLAEDRGVPALTIDPLEELGWSDDYSGWECGQESTNPTTRSG